MIICVVGPTGVGKTKLSIALAKIYNGEIINADAMQVYECLDIGTAKVTEKEKEHIPHHLFDICDVFTNYTVYQYQKDARKKIEEITSREKVPIFVGGTGYYLKSALFNYQFEEEDTNNGELYENLSNEELCKRISSYETGIIVDPSNRRRNIRLLQKLEEGTFSFQNDFTALYGDVIMIGLTMERSKLYERTDKRLDDMAIDLVDEVKPFYLQGIKTKVLMTGIGYKELYPFFENKETLRSCVEKIKQNTRNYAKRQYTYFENQLPVKWVEVDPTNFQKTINESVNLIENELEKTN